MRADESLAESPSDGVHSRTPLWARFLVLIYFFAGLTSIAYEVLWVRMLGLQFGASIFGVIITVAAFMAGLGAGSLLGTMIAPRLRRPLLLFALLEAAVALFSLAMPALFQALGARLTLASAESGLGAWYGIQASAYFLVLFVPAFAMGMGFPAVLRVFIATPVNLAKVYGLNTLGGAAGADLAREDGSLWAALLRQGAAVARLSMPVTLLLGAWLPGLSIYLDQGG